MNLLISIMVGVLFGASAFLMLARELKGVCMGVFLLGHGANLAILAVSGTPAGKLPPVLAYGVDLHELVDPLPQALILTAIVIGFAVQALLLTIIVITWRRHQTLSMAVLAEENDH
ncbi:MAG: NADH-quinone oxidoreductase subunit K [Phycisphaeraceae bacterium]|nr:NADH-quinone oxidoreductase subunit K [Phycisphaeraceae bacterium]